MKSAGVLILGLLMSSVLWAEEMISGKVVTVIDGNTLEVYTNDNETYKILLYGIDSPELGQEYGDKAKRFLEKLILEKNVSVQISKTNHCLTLFVEDDGCGFDINDDRLKMDGNGLKNMKT